MIYDSRFKIQENGQAALIAVILMLVIMLSAVFGTTAIALKEAKVAEENKKSRLSFFSAEAGIEDAVYRLLRNKNLSASFAVSLNGTISTVTATDISSSQKIIKSSSDLSGSARALQTKLETSTANASFFYGVQVGDGGLEMGNNSRVNGNVFSNSNITGLNSAKITGDAIVASGISDEPGIQWVTNDADQYFATASSNQDIAQSFIAGASDKINRASVYLSKVGAPTGNITLRIAADDGGSPNKNSIANAIISNASVGYAPSWINVSFSSPPMLVNGSKYWIVLDYSSNSPVNHWNWRKDSTDNYLNNTSKYTTNCCSGNPTWTNIGGDLAFRVWLGGVNTKIEGITIGDATIGSGHANLFVNTTIHGSACPNSYCIIDDQVRQELPISDGVVDDWKDAALVGGTCAPPLCSSSGDFSLSGGDTASIGPIYIPGALSLNNNAALTMTGTIWVGGDASFNNDSVVNLSASYGEYSGVIVVSGDTDVNNDVVLAGSGDPKSYLMLVSAKNDPTGIVININNDSTAAIYYANHGKIKFNNDAAAKEATAYGIVLNNDAAITYESGLANVNFSAGPSAGWDIVSWEEIIP